MDQEILKQKTAEAAIQYISDGCVVGVGTGTTVNYFIDELKKHKARIEGAVASSKATADRLKAHGIPLIDANSSMDLDVYIDGADEINHHLQCIKGGGGALTGEKILAAMAKKFICIAHESKYVKMLGKFPLPLEVIPMARSYVAREIIKLKGDPIYREGFVSDYGNIILDIYNLEIQEPIKLEQQLNQIAGVVTCGIFASRRADLLLLADNNEVKKIIA